MNRFRQIIDILFAIVLLIAIVMGLMFAKITFDTMKYQERKEIKLDNIEDKLVDKVYQRINK